MFNCYAMCFFNKSYLFWNPTTSDSGDVPQQHNPQRFKASLGVVLTASPTLSDVSHWDHIQQNNRGSGPRSTIKSTCFFFWKKSLILVGIYVFQPIPRDSAWLAGWIIHESTGSFIPRSVMESTSGTSKGDMTLQVVYDKRLTQRNCYTSNEILHIKWNLMISNWHHRW